MLRLFTMVLVLTALSGCFDLEQKLSVSSSDARYDVAVVVKSDVLDTLEKRSEDGYCDIQFDELDDGVPEGVTRSVQQEADDEGVHCGVSYQGPLAAMRELILRKGGEHPVDLFELTESGPNRLRLETRYGGDVSAESEGVGRLARRIVAAAFADSALVWRVEAPAIIATNGRISEDGRSVEWELSLQDLIESGEPGHFYVEMSVNDSGAIDL